MSTKTGSTTGSPDKQTRKIYIKQWTKKLGK